MTRRTTAKKSRQRRTSAKKSQCICGCGKDVTRPTELNHLGAQAPALIRARLVEEDQVFRLGLKRRPWLRPAVPEDGEEGMVMDVAVEEDGEEGMATDVAVEEDEDSLGLGCQPLSESDPPDNWTTHTMADDTHNTASPDPNPVVDKFQTATVMRWGLQQRDESDVQAFSESDDDDEMGFGLPGELTVDGSLRAPVALDEEDEYEDEEESGGEGEGSDEEGELEEELEQEDVLANSDAYFRLEFQREAAKLMSLDPFDLTTARRFAFKVEGHLSERLFNQLPQVYPDVPHQSLKSTKKHIESLSGFKSVRYACCVNSCVCFTGTYEGLDQCPICKEGRFKRNGRPRKYFEYIPLIPRLKSMVANKDNYANLLHRSQHVSKPGVIKDIYDGTHYQELLRKTVPDSNPPTNFFADRRDIALGMSTDGFGPFRRRDKTSWPIILFNYNLSPKIRFQKKHCINIGTVPGPRKPHDWDSFLWPLFKELVELELGIEAYDVVEDELFVLCAFLIVAFGDIPAVSLMMRMKGQNAVRPCRMCKIRGVSIVRTLYVPLCRSCLYENPDTLDEEEEDIESEGDAESTENECEGMDEDQVEVEVGPEDGNEDGYEDEDEDEDEERENDVRDEEDEGDVDGEVEEDVTADYDPSNLPMRTHEEFMAQAMEVQLSRTHAEGEQLAKEYGIKGIPLLSYLSSMSFPFSFPFDFMHLIWENTLKNLLLFWTGKFKDLSHANKDYVISPDDWAAIGKETVACNATIPSSFGASVPDLSRDGVIMTAEMHANWTMFIAPIVLKGRLKPRYYDHFMQLHHLIGLCTAVETEAGTLDLIEQGFQEWVSRYEQLYYEQDHNRISACPLTIHALLHIADGIRACGPVWAYWAYPMERHCNTLLPAIRSRRHPYASIAAFVTAIAQLDQIRFKFNAENLLRLDPPKLDKGLLLPLYPYYKLTYPRRRIQLSDTADTVTLRAKVWGHLATRFLERDIEVIKNAFPLEDEVLQYGRVVKLDLDDDDGVVSTGDVMRGVDLLTTLEDTRDATFVRYDCAVDRRANQRHQPEEMVMKTFFGQLKFVLVLTLPPTPRLLAQETTLALAVIGQAKLMDPRRVRDPIEAKLFTALLKDEVVDLSTVKSVVGRIKYGNGWVIVDRNEHVDFSLD